MAAKIEDFSKKTLNELMRSYQQLMEQKVRLQNSKKTLPVQINMVDCDLIEIQKIIEKDYPAIAKQLGKAAGI